MRYSIPSIFGKINHYIQTLGVEVVIGKLDELKSHEINIPDTEIMKFILSECCSFYEVNVTEVKTTERIGPKAIVARDMYFVLVKKNLPNLTDSDIGKTIGKSKSPVCRAWKEFLVMDKKIKHEREFLEALTYLNDRICNYREQIKITKI